MERERTEEREIMVDALLIGIAVVVVAVFGAVAVLAVVCKWRTSSGNSSGGGGWGGNSGGFGGGFGGGLSGGDGGYDGGGGDGGGGGGCD